MIARAFLVVSLLFAALPLQAAVERFLRVEAPATARAGEHFRVTVKAGTDAGKGEQVGMFQVDISTDGKTWNPARYLDGLGATTTQEIDVTAGAAGTKSRLRVRVAFRGGLAGDVDYSGGAIRWKETWGEWAEPPAKSVEIAVTAP